MIVHALLQLVLVPFMDLLLSLKIPNLVLLLQMVILSMQPHRMIAVVSHIPVTSIIIWKWSIQYTSLAAMFNPLHSKNEPRTVWKVPLSLSKILEVHKHLHVSNIYATMKTQMVPHTPVNGAMPISNHLKPEVTIRFRC